MEPELNRSVSKKMSMRAEIPVLKSNGKCEMKINQRNLLSLISAILLIMFNTIFGADMKSNFKHYKWPKEVTVSDRYKVFVKSGRDPEQEIQVLMSHAKYKGDFMAKELKDRTFSYASLSFSGGKIPLKFRIIHRFSGPVETVSIHPQSYKIIPGLVKGGKEASFTVKNYNRYFSVFFKTPENLTSKRKWVKHMLCIFIDPIETDIPKAGDPGAVLYAPRISYKKLQKAKTIIFPPGYHNLREYRGDTERKKSPYIPAGNEWRKYVRENNKVVAFPPGFRDVPGYRIPVIDRKGCITLQDGQSVYIAGGAFVEGMIYNFDDRQKTQRIYGRGILSGRQYMWVLHPDWRGSRMYWNIISVSPGSTIEGITIIDPPMHGIIGMENIKIINTKLIGWHGNNDGVRVHSGSEISHSFFRCVDDHFYNYDIYVHDCVLWAGWNGAILTFGWSTLPHGYPAITQKYGSSVFENIDIIHPEWQWLANNSGLLASQLKVFASPYDYGEDTTTVMRNIRIEGTIPGLVNLKPMKWKGKFSTQKFPEEKIGYLGDIILENISVNNVTGKGLIQGQENVSLQGNTKYYVRNVLFRNVRIKGVLLTEENKDKYLNIDPNTTRDIRFEKEKNKYVPDKKILNKKNKGWTEGLGTQAHGTDGKPT
jgi:hypothetical protein